MLILLLFFGGRVHWKAFLAGAVLVLMALSDLEGGVKVIKAGSTWSGVAWWACAFVLLEMVPNAERRRRRMAIPA